MIDENYAVKIPDSIPMEKAAPLISAAAAIYDPLKYYEAGPGKRIGVIGLYQKHNIEKKEEIKKLYYEFRVSRCIKSLLLAWSFALFVCYKNKEEIVLRSIASTASGVHAMEESGKEKSTQLDYQPHDLHFRFNHIRLRRTWNDGNHDCESFQMHRSYRVCHLT